MNILNEYNWIDINNQYGEYKKWYNKWIKEKTNEAKKAFKENCPAPTYLKPTLSSYELKQMDLTLANVKAVRVGEKYSASETLKGVEDESLRALITFLYRLTSRSELYTGSGKDNTRHCALVPLFLAAQKEFNGIQYEEWDKNDSFINILVGDKLWMEIEKWKDIPLADSALKVARENALRNKQGKRIDPSSWPFHSIDIGGVKAPASSLGRHILMQTWLANVETRNEFMILDFTNWDLMPKAFDAVFKPQVKEEIIHEDLEEMLPW